MQNTERRKRFEEPPQEVTTDWADYPSVSNLFDRYPTNLMSHCQWCLLLIIHFFVNICFSYNIRTAERNSVLTMYEYECSIVF